MWYSVGMMNKTLNVANQNMWNMGKSVVTELEALMAVNPSKRGMALLSKWDNFSKTILECPNKLTWDDYRNWAAQVMDYTFNHTK